MNPLYKSMRFREWLITESSNQVVLMKAVHDDGAESIKKDGFQLQDRHRSTANYYKKYGDTDTSQMYGPGLYFTIVPAGQDPTEYAKKNCGMYAKEWGNNIVFATIRQGGRGLVTGFPPNHPMWKYIASKNTYVYDQLEALGVDKIVGYTKDNVHVDKEWGYKLHDKMDFWAHSHWAEGGEARLNVVVYNPSVLQMVGTVECEPGMSKPKKDSNPEMQSKTVPSVARPKSAHSGDATPIGKDYADFVKKNILSDPQNKDYLYWKSYVDKVLKNPKHPSYSYFATQSAQNPTMVRRRFPDTNDDDRLDLTAWELEDL